MVLAGRPRLARARRGPLDLLRHLGAETAVMEADDDVSLGGDADGGATAERQETETSDKRE